MKQLNITTGDGRGPQVLRPVARTAAVYARVSTRDKEQNPETQLLALRDYATRRGFTAVEEYVDNGVSGRKESRPALDQLMKDVRRGRFDAVIDNCRGSC